MTMKHQGWLEPIPRNGQKTRFGWSEEPSGMRDSFIRVSQNIFFWNTAVIKNQLSGLRGPISHLLISLPKIITAHPGWDDEIGNFFLSFLPLTGHGCNNYQTIMLESCIGDELFGPVDDPFILPPEPLWFEWHLCLNLPETPSNQRLQSFLLWPKA